MPRPSKGLKCPVCGEPGSGSYKKSVGKGRAAKRYSYFYHPKGNSVGKKWCYLRLGLLRTVYDSRVDADRADCQVIDRQVYVELGRQTETETPIIRCSYGTKPIIWFLFSERSSVGLDDRLWQQQVDALYEEVRGPGGVRDALKYSQPSTHR